MPGQGTNTLKGQIQLTETMYMHMYMYVQLLRQGNVRQLLFFPKRKRRAASGGIQTRDILRASVCMYGKLKQLHLKTVIGKMKDGSQTCNILYTM